MTVEEQIINALTKPMTVKALRKVVQFRYTTIVKMIDEGEIVENKGKISRA